MNELLMEGLLLMGVGMGVVFLFLGLLVGVISAVSALIRMSEAARDGDETLDDEELLAVLNEAVSRYRADHSN